LEITAFYGTGKMREITISDEITLSDHEKYLYFGYVPRWSEASLDWLNCDFQSAFGKGVNNEFIKPGIADKSWPVVNCFVIHFLDGESYRLIATKFVDPPEKGSFIQVRKQ